MTTRRHDIDALRVIAFGLLILYHTGMVYVADWGFHIKSEHTAEWLQWPMLFMNRWRMCLLFMISAIAIALAAPEGRLPRFAGQRTWRLMLPLIFGMFVVVPIQPYCEGVAGGHVAPGFGQFLLRYWQVRPWPPHSFTGWEHGITWNHLWYLPYLWAYTLILVAAMPLLSRPPVRGAVTAFCRAPAVLFIGLPAAVLTGFLLRLHPLYPDSGAFFGDWYQHAKYGFVFLAGYLLAREAVFWDRVVSMRRSMLVTAMIAVTVWFGLRLAGQLLPQDALAYRIPDSVWHPFAATVETLYLWTMLLAILGWAKTILDRPFRWLPYATEAVYPWYMLHQSLIVALVFWLKPMGLGPVVEPTLVILGTVAGCFALHELVIRRIGLVRPLFGLKAAKATAPRLPRPSSARAEQTP